ncbi:MAG: V-type ATP synthase subunit E [Eubacteriales bacterium]|jgi:V/A-type H+-transporting ATPase subunit E
MTQDEKLENFLHMSVETAQQESQKALDEYQAQLDRSFEEHKAVRRQQAADAVRDEKVRAEREINRQLSSREIDIRQTIAQRQDELKTHLFERVAEKLQAFKGTKDYEDFLVRKINEAKKFAGKDEMTVYIDPSDAALADTLAKKTGVTPIISKEEFVGGMRAVIRSRNVLIDNSFKTLMADQRDSYSFEGGVQE